MQHLPLLDNKRPTVFVWTIWAIMVLVALLCVFIYGRNIPLAEDWHLVSAVTGNEPKISNWLWLQNNEHRIPFPKLMLLFLLKISNGDFRVGMAFTIICVSLLAAYFIKVFYNLRGSKLYYTDAFFPLLLLHLGNWENFFWAWELTFVTATILTCILISTVLQLKNLISMPHAIVSSFCMMLLPLSGANGLLYLLPVMPWLALQAYFHVSSKEAAASRRIGISLIISLALTLLLVIVYFVGYQHPTWYPPSPGIFATLKTAVKFMALSFGPAVSRAWGVSGLFAFALTLATAILLISTIIKSRYRGPEFRRAGGLFLFLGGNVLFALAMGYGRAAQVASVGLPIRYVFLSMPLLIICYSTWQFYGLPLSRKMIQWGLFITMLILIVPNTRKGFNWRDYCVQGADSVIHDINYGVPRSALVERHVNFLLHWDKNMLAKGMQQLKEARMGPFKNMKSDTVISSLPSLPVSTDIK
ncbi:MAG: hypothetical protein JWP81_2674 [Ferruginibacter sp.]|nr:hypothetical protein [Ferruginibacter sp.]